MNRDQRQLMVIHGGANAWQCALVYLDLAVSAKARRRRNRLLSVSKILYSSLSGEDDLVFVVTKQPAKVLLGHPLKWVLLAALVATVVLEYRNYSIPTMSHWLQTLLHRCGL